MTDLQRHITKLRSEAQLRAELAAVGALLENERQAREAAERTTRRLRLQIARMQRSRP